MSYKNQNPQEPAAQSMTEAQREDEMRYNADRISEIFVDRDALVDEFLLSWLPHRQLKNETILQCFDRWTADKWPYVPLNTAARGMLLHYITHTPSGRTRILLAGKRGPDKFTGCLEDSRVSGAVIHRMKEGGDLAKRDDEKSLEYVERIRSEVVIEPKPPKHEEQAALQLDDEQDSIFE